MLGGHFAHKCKTSWGIFAKCHVDWQKNLTKRVNWLTSCWLTEEFDEGGKLINVVQFQKVIDILLILRG